MGHGRLVLAALVAALATSGIAAAAAATERAPAALLPDLVQERPRDLQLTAVATPSGERFRLGFRSGVHNAGTGPLVIEASRASTGDALMTGRQLVLHDDGRVAAHDAGARLRYTRSPDHRHWHLLGFETYELRSADGALARPARKSGFCLGDRYNEDFFSTRPFEPERGAFTHFCGLDRPGLLRLRMGISVGFGDDYDPQLEGQYVDVTGLPSGRYDLVHRVDAGGALLESDRSNNAACTGVRLAWPRGAQRRPRFTATECHTQPTITEVT